MRVGILKGKFHFYDFCGDTSFLFCLNSFIGFLSGQKSSKAIQWGVAGFMYRIAALFTSLCCEIKLGVICRTFAGILLVNLNNEYWSENYLTLSWQSPSSYRNQPIDLQSKSMGWFLYDNGLHLETVK